MATFRGTGKFPQHRAEPKLPKSVEELDYLHCGRGDHRHCLRQYSLDRAGEAFPRTRLCALSHSPALGGARFVGHDWMEVDPRFNYSVITWVLVWLGFVQPYDTPMWLGEPKLAMASVILVHCWRLIPFSTVILLAGRTAIPREIPEAAA